MLSRKIAKDVILNARRQNLPIRILSMEDFPVQHNFKLDSNIFFVSFNRTYIQANDITIFLQFQKTTKCFTDLDRTLAK